MRLLAERLLPDCRSYLQGEVTFERIVLPPPRHNRRFHLFLSPFNTAGHGARALIDELLAHQPAVAPLVTEDVDVMSDAEHFLLYLDACTWTSAHAESLAAHVAKAKEVGTHLLLVHEMPVRACPWECVVYLPCSRRESASLLPPSAACARDVPPNRARQGAPTAPPLPLRRCTRRWPRQVSQACTAASSARSSPSRPRGSCSLASTLRWVVSSYLSAHRTNSSVRLAALALALHSQAWCPHSRRRSSPR